MNQVQTSVADSGSDSVSKSVVEAVAEAEGVDPVDLSPPLYEAADPDALDGLFAPTTTDGRMAGVVTFVYAGYEVTVAGDGHVSVTPLDG